MQMSDYSKIITMGDIDPSIRLITVNEAEYLCLKAENVRLDEYISKYNCLMIEYDELKRENERLKQYIAECESKLDEETEKLESQLQSAREVIEFYADPETYFAVAHFGDSGSETFFSDIEETGYLGKKPGKRAREWLSKHEEVNEGDKK